MTGEELAFWTMMGFSCLIGIFIGYLLFSPRKTREPVESLGDIDDAEDFYDTDTDVTAHGDTPGPAVAAQQEPWLADRETLREKARERAMTRMAESEKRIRQEQQAVASAGGAATGSSAAPSAPAAADQPYPDPQTIKAWDDTPPPSRRRRPGTWVKAEPADD